MNRCRRSMLAKSFTRGVYMSDTFLHLFLRILINPRTKATSKTNTNSKCIIFSYKQKSLGKYLYKPTSWHHLPNHRERKKYLRVNTYVQSCNHYTSSVTNILRELKWSTLEQRRNQGSIIMLNKIQCTVVTNRSLYITVILQIHETINP